MNSNLPYTNKATYPCFSMTQFGGPAQNQAIAQRLAKSLTADGRPLEDIARLADVHPDRLERLTKGEATPAPGEVLRLSLVLRVLVTELDPHAPLGEMAGPMLRLMEYLRAACNDDSSEP